MKIDTEAVKWLQVHRPTCVYCEDDCHIFANFLCERSKNLTRFIHNIPRRRFQRHSALRAWKDWSCMTQLSLTLLVHTTALDSTTIEWGTCTEQTLEDSISSTTFLNTVYCVCSPPDKTLVLPCPVYLSGLVALRNISREVLEPPTLRIRSVATYTVGGQHVDGWAVRQTGQGNHRVTFLISNFRRVLNVLCFLLGNSPTSDFYMPTFRNTPIFIGG
jgi:hypothetical protein